jgi:hypothetical protein
VVDLFGVEASAAVQPAFDADSVLLHALGQ